MIAHNPQVAQRSKVNMPNPRPESRITIRRLTMPRLSPNDLARESKQPSWIHSSSTHPWHRQSALHHIASLTPCSVIHLATRRAFREIFSSKRTKYLDVQGENSQASKPVIDCSQHAGRSNVVQCCPHAWHVDHALRRLETMQPHLLNGKSTGHATGRKHTKNIIGSTNPKTS